MQDLLRFPQLLQLHGQLTLPDLVLRERLQVTCQPQLRANPDEPFGGVVLVPLDSISVIHGELVMEVVISLANGNERGDEVILWCVLVVERSLSEPVS